MSHASAVARSTHAAQNAGIYALLSSWAERTPAAIAITAPGRTPLTYRRLRPHLRDVVARLNAMGLGRNDRVALVLPQGPEMAVAFLAVAAGATCAPLNPAYRANEFDAALAELRAKALMVQSGMESPARAAAQARGIPVIELSPAFEAEAGLFTLSTQCRDFTPTRTLPSVRADKNRCPPSPQAGEGRDGGAIQSAAYVWPTALSDRDQSHACQVGFAQPNDTALVLLTSGTTARPKLVPLTHTNICTVADNIRVALGLVESDRCLDVMPLFHVHGLITAMLSSLVAGASVICTPTFHAPKFFEWMEECRPTWCTAAPTLHHAVLAYAASKREIIERCPLRFIRSSAAALPPQVLGELETTFHAPVIEAYGMTECAQIACNPLPPGRRKLGSVGIAAGPEVAIMDEADSLLPPGETGEIVIRGASVAQGYENRRPDAESSPVSDWFRTGDQGCIDADGYLFVTGRFKEIINRGGEKIAPREIEEVLMDHPAVAQVVAFAVPHARLGEDVAVAVVLRAPGSATERELREFAALRLADFKVPSQVVFVEEIPKGPTGKLQRIGLAERLGITAPNQNNAQRQEMGAEFVAPRTALERELAEIWAQVLEPERQLGVYDNFFELGGDSVLATQLISRVCQGMQVQLSLLSLFEEASTLAGMAESVEAARSAEGKLPLPPIERVSRHRELALSFAQERLWFLDQLEPGMAAYNIPKAFRVTGALDVTALAQSLNEIIRRHEALRTTFTAIDGRPVQSIASALPLALSVVDLRGLAETEREARAQRLATEEARYPFALARGPLLRAALLQLGEQDYLFILTMHHIVSDGWSLGVLFRELATLYEAFSTGRPSPLPELPIQYADFAHWQRQWLQGEVLNTQLSYWTRQLAGDLPVLQLPTDRPRSAVQTFSGSKHSVELSQPVTRALKALSRREGTTLFMTLLAAFKTLLYRYTGQQDILVGCPVTNRNRMEVEGLIGFFVNTLVLRTDLSGTPSFRELLARVRKVALGAYAHQDLAFEHLVEALQPARTLSHPPFFQTFFNLLKVTDDRLELSGLTLSPMEIDNGTAKFDLTLAIVEEAERLTATLNYNTDLFDGATIARMLGHFQTLLAGIAADPDRRLSAFPLLTATERSRQSMQGNRVRPAHPFVEFPAAEIGRSIPDRFAQQVKQYPQHIAVKTAHYEWTYEVLNGMVQQVAHTILNRCGTGEARIALVLGHDAPMLAGILGVLSAGKTYVPLDPSYPMARLAYMLEDCRASAILTNTRNLACAKALATATLPLLNLDELACPAIGEPVHHPIAPDTPAYILYTSGSTGQPKGVVQNHRNVLHFIRAYTNNLHISPSDRLTLFSSYSFDAAIMDIFGALLNGATLYPMSPREEGFAEIAAWLQTHEITIYHSTPTVYRYVVSTLDGTEEFPKLRLVVLGGEAVYKRDVELYKRYFSPECLLVNGLGPTESTVSLQYFVNKQTEIPRNAVPVGYPVEGTAVCLLDEAGEPTEITGEIALRSAHLALGYWRQPELTQAAFLPDPEGGDRRLYRTGDLGRVLPDGGIEFMGRKDFQVKVRGYRIEVSEIETRLLEHGAIQEAVVLAQEEGSGDRRLVAYVVAKQGQPLMTLELRTFLKEKLPDYMVPSAFVQLDTLPQTPTGKIDRQALPLPDRVRPDLEGTFVAPRTPVEEVVAGIWAEVLRLERIGVHDHFFDLGGHSLSATQIMSRIRRALQVELSVRALFEAPTVAGLAEAIEQARGSDSAPRASAIVPISREVYRIKRS